MTSVLIYFFVTIIVAVVLFVLAMFFFGRGESLPPVAKGETLTKLPTGDIDGQSVRDLRFGVRARGYDMEEVDWAIEQLAAEIERLRGDSGTRPSSSTTPVTSTKLQQKRDKRGAGEAVANRAVVREDE